MTIAKRPDLRVIDIAIKRIRDGNNCFSCVALDGACCALGINGDTSLEFRRQYMLATKRANGGALPRWWDSCSSVFAPARIAALRHFRQACIDAANKPT